jgi:hydroxylamine reductase
MKTIKKNTKLSELLEINPDAIEHLFDAGMHCIGCPAATMETLEEGCMAHGMSKKEINDLIKKLNAPVH